MTQQSPEFTDITSDDKLWALLSYLIPIIVPIIVLLMDDKKNRPFIKAHAMQALVWGVVYGVISGILSFLFIGICLGLICYGVSIYWGIKAYQGEYVNIPVITDFCKKQGWA
jgi:uncharacterized membrane protein